MSIRSVRKQLRNEKRKNRAIEASYNVATDAWRNVIAHNEGMRRVLRVLSVALIIVAMVCGFSLAAHAQTDNTVYVKQMPGHDVASKTTAAQASPPCFVAGNGPGGHVDCLIIFDPTLANWPTGSMPSPCANCIWIDYRTGTPWLPAFSVTANRFIIGAAGNKLTNSNFVAVTNGFQLGTSSSANCTITSVAFSPMLISCNAQGVELADGTLYFSNQTSGPSITSGTTGPMTFKLGTISANRYAKMLGNIIAFAGTDTCPTNDPVGTGGGAICMTNGGTGLAASGPGGVFEPIPYLLGDLGNTVVLPWVISLHLGSHSRGITDYLGYSLHGNGIDVQLSDGTHTSNNCLMYGPDGETTDSGAQCSGKITRSDRTTATCTAATGIGNPCTFTITWSPTFVDTSYTTELTGINPTGNCGPPYEVSHTASTFTVGYMPMDGGACTYAHVNAYAVHD